MKEGHRGLDIMQLTLCLKLKIQQSFVYVVITLIIGSTDFTKCPYSCLVCQYVFQELALDNETSAIVILLNP